MHEMFANGFGQTADMREFPSQIRVGPGGDFLLAKGGQQATTQGKHNGTVLRVSADGRTTTVIGRRCKRGNTFSRPVLIGRGLEIFSVFVLAMESSRGGCARAQRTRLTTDLRWQ